MTKERRANRTHRSSDERGTSGRDLAADIVSIKVINTYPLNDGTLISGICTFHFKNPRTEVMESAEVCDLSLAAVPSGSELDFKASLDRCVSSYRVDLVIRKRDGSEETRLIDRPNRPGRCWPSATFSCGPKKEYDVQTPHMKLDKEKLDEELKDELIIVDPSDFPPLPPEDDTGFPTWDEEQFYRIGGTATGGAFLGGALSVAAGSGMLVGAFLGGLLGLGIALAAAHKS